MIMFAYIKQNQQMQKNKLDLFSQFVASPDYTNMEATIQAIPHLVSLTRNYSTEDLKCKGLIIRSGNDDNIHKAIKYGIWTTTYKNKSKLQAYWKEHEQNNIDTYLFFSTIKSGVFSGVARLVSGYNEETFPYWWDNQNGKFKGHFQIEWVSVKDIYYKGFNGIKNKNGQEVIRSKDCDEVNEEGTKKMLTIFKEDKSNVNLLTYFEAFDQREKQYLRGMLTPEQEMWLMNEQMRQMQIQQQQYAMLSQQSMKGFYQEVQQPLITNPGFQMNPVSKNKKYKQK